LKWISLLLEFISPGLFLVVVSDFLTDEALLSLNTFD
jgi:hypothetical protein